MSDLKKYINIIEELESGVPSLDSPRQDGRTGTRNDLRNQMFQYLNDAQEAIDQGNGETAKEYIGYVIELVDDNV